MDGFQKIFSPLHPAYRQSARVSPAGRQRRGDAGLGRDVGTRRLLAADTSGGAATAVNPLAPKTAHFPAKAKSVIWLFMNGGPSQVDTWDYKPELAKRDGQELKGFDNNTGFFPIRSGR